EIRDLDDIVGKLEHELALAMQKLVTAKTELKQVGNALDGLRTQVHEGDVAIMGHEKDDARVRGELERHRDRLGQLATEQLELDHRLRAIEIDDAAARERRTTAIDRIAALERIQLDLVADVAAHRDRVEDLVAALTEARVRAAQLGEKRAAAEAATLRRRTSDALAAELTQLELRHGQIVMTRGNVEAQVGERYQLDITAILYDFHQRAHVTDVEEARLVELRELIDRMGTDINLTAIEEF